MHREEILKLIGNNMPCLLCPVVLRGAADAGLWTIAFDLQSVAEAVWISPALTIPAKAKLNNLLASMVQQVQSPQPNRYALAESAETEIAQMTSIDPALCKLISGFLGRFTKPYAD